jgi:uncharacterized protein
LVQALEREPYNFSYWVMATEGACPIWIASHYALTPTLDIIVKVPSDTPILILQGKNDSQTTIQQALLLQQKLTEVGHPDHTLITYPNLGHASILCLNG